MSEEIGDKEGRKPRDVKEVKQKYQQDTCMAMWMMKLYRNLEMQGVTYAWSPGIIAPK